MLLSFFYGFRRSLSFLSAAGCEHGIAPLVTVARPVCVCDRIWFTNFHAAVLTRGTVQNYEVEKKLTSTFPGLARTPGFFEFQLDGTGEANELV
jgi:hypothetical protein